MEENKKPTQQEAFAQLLGGKQGQAEAPVVEEGNVEVEKENTVEQPAVEAQPENTVSDTQDTSKQPEVSELPDIAKLTDGKFNSLDDLVSDYQTLLKEKQSGSATKNLMEDEDFKSQLEEYFKITSVDYTSMSPEQLIRHKMRSDYDMLNDSEFEKFFRKTLERDYGLDGDDEEADEYGLLRMKADAEKVRKELIQKQKDAKMPEWKVEQQPQNQPASEDIQKMQEAVENFLNSDKATKQLRESKMLSVKHGNADPYNIEVADPNQLVEAVRDYNKINEWISDGQGNIDTERLYKGLAYIANPEAFEKALIAYGKNIGKDSTLDVLENPSKIDTVSAPKSESGDVKTGILRELLKKQGKQPDF